MAWTGVCKVNFIQAVKHLTIVKGLSLRKALKKLSEESGIAFKTLEMWFYEDVKKSTLENQGINEDPENTEEKEEQNESRRPLLPVCRACGRSDITFVKNGSGKPYGLKSKFYMLCDACATQLKRANKTKEEDGIKYVCPHCGGGFSVPLNTAKAKIKRYEEGLKNGETI